MDSILEKIGLSTPETRHGASRRASRAKVGLGSLPPLGPETMSNQFLASRLGAMASLSRHKQPLRAGYLWLAGQVAVEPPGSPISVCCPLLCAPVRLDTYTGLHTLERAGDVVTHPLVTDRREINWRELLPSFPYLTSAPGIGPALGIPPQRASVALAGVKRVSGVMAAQIGLSIDEVLGPVDPVVRSSQPGLVLVIGTGVFIDSNLAMMRPGWRMQRWYRDAESAWSAFGNLYGTGAGPVVALTSHYRCVPHLIEFSARRFYGNNLRVVTRNPGNDEADLIDVVVVEGKRDTLDHDASDEAWEMVNDPSSFNVMVTRARRRMIVAVGDFVVDIVLRGAVGGDGQPIAVCCRLEPEHIERELMLHRMGWRVVYATADRLSGRAHEVAIDVGDDVVVAAP